jgi:hypothetical protein
MPRKQVMFKTEAERFWPKVDKNGPAWSDKGSCWVWMGARIWNGYGHFCLTQFPGTPKRLILAHRWAYQDRFGEIPAGLEIDHLCRNRGCVNPDHMEPVTHRENARRGIAGEISMARQRGKTHCPQGHEYSPENTYIWAPTGQRYCKQCDRERKRAKAQARKGAI